MLGTTVAHDGGVVPACSDAGADEEPEEAGGAAVEKDVPVRVHGGMGSMSVGGGFIAARDVGRRKRAAESAGERCRRG